MKDFLAQLSAVGFFICIVLTLWHGIKKRPTKRYKTMMIAFFILLLATGTYVTDSEDDPSALEDTQNSQSENQIKDSPPANKIETENVNSEKSGSQNADDTNIASISSAEDSSIKPSNTPDTCTSVFYLDLWDNFEKYENSYVRFSGPISYISGSTVNIKGEIEGVTGMITIDFIDSNDYKKFKEGDYITVVGYAYQKILGYVYIKQAYIEPHPSVDIVKNFNAQRSEYVANKEAILLQEKTDFINSCVESYSYTDLIRNPDNYVNSHIKIRVNVGQKMSGSFLDSGPCFRCTKGDNEYIVYDTRDAEQPKVLKDDNITVYGIINGTRVMKRAITREEIEVPRIDAKYIEIG